MGGDRKRYKPSPQSKGSLDTDTPHNLLCALRNSQTSSSERLAHSVSQLVPACKI